VIKKNDRKIIRLDFNIFQCKKCGRFMKLLKRDKKNYLVYKYCSKCNIIYQLKVKEGVI